MVIISSILTLCFYRYWSSFFIIMFLFLAKLVFIHFNCYKNRWISKLNSFKSMLLTYYVGFLLENLVEHWVVYCAIKDKFKSVFGTRITNE